MGNHGPFSFADHAGLSQTWREEIARAASVPCHAQEKDDPMKPSMKSVNASVVLALLGAAMLNGCNSGPTPTSTQTTEASPPATPVVRETSTAPDTGPPIAPMAAPTVIQSQPGSDGSQLDLLKVAVTGDILTVTLRCSSDKKFNTRNFSLKDVSVIDDATSQRIAVLKDSDGNWLASKVSGDNMFADCTVQPGILWAKFAAPSAGAKTVSVNLPEVAPFDGVPVTH